MNETISRRTALTTTAAAATLIATAGPARAQAAFKLGVVAFQMSSETHARVANTVEAEAKKKGWQVTLLNSRGSQPEHVAQIDNLVQAGVNGMILCMARVNEAEAQLAAAKAKGIPVITVMANTTPNALFDISVDDFAAGSQITNYLLARMNYEGGLLAQRYEGNVSTRARGKVFDAVLSENTGVKVLGQHVMARPQGWQEDVRQGMETLTLRHQGQFKGIWAAFDGQAFIIDDILQSRGAKKGDVLVTGVDGGQETFKRIRDPKSTLSATVAIPFEPMGVRAVDLMDRIVVQKQPKEKHVAGARVLVPTVLVDETNVPGDGAWPW
ncbi:MAG: sugar ABC transporter substrate-binding protein [Alphaproteobacteria bacterium]|nr:sugar ABC transporter substrate-binding protein [Alphaproteobacteria bacterium]